VGDIGAVVEWIAQTRVGFLTSGRRKSFLSLPQKELHITKQVVLRKEYGHHPERFVPADVLCLAAGEVATDSGDENASIATADSVDSCGLLGSKSVGSNLGWTHARWARQYLRLRKEVCMNFLVPVANTSHDIMASEVSILVAENTCQACSKDSIAKSHGKSGSKYSI